MAGDRDRVARVAAECRVSPVGQDLHVFTLVGIRADQTEHTFYRWAFLDTASTLAVSAFGRALEAGEQISDEPAEDPGRAFVAWRLQCSCEWVSARAQRPAELAGIGFVHLLAQGADWR